MGSRILFDASSTNPISEIIAVAPGACVQINAWNLAVGETAQVFRALVELGFIGSSAAGSCAPPPGVTPSSIITEGEYLPCNVPVEVGQEPNLNITTLVIQQPGYYRVHLTPAALGTAFVEAIVLNADECEAASRACCCTPETWWQGVSLNPCLTITPGGDAGHAPIFNLDACCLFQSLAPNPNPVLSDELIFLSEGACFRATIDQVFSSAIVCDSLGEQPLLAPAAGDQVVGLDAGANCKRMDGETFVEFFETPWTGISITPALVIAPGGVNGHGPTFSYDLCADIQAQASCACEPNPGDQILIVQGGACVLATWPTVDVCDQLGLLPNGALIAGDTALVREAGGACKQVLATAFATPSFPILAPDGSCLAPTYSFASSPDSGMFYDPAGLGSVIIGDDNCVDFISVGASISATSSVGVISLSAPVGGIAIAGGVGGVGIMFTTSALALQFFTGGEWLIGGTAGIAGQAIVSNGPGTIPTWQTPSGVAEPITQIVYGTGPAVDSDPFFIFNNATGAFGVNSTAGGGRPAALGGGLTPVRIFGRDGTTNGANVEVRGGDANVVGATGGGGVVTQGGLGGQFGNGGTNEVFGGNTTFINRSGGLVTIKGGNNTNGVADTGNNGGGVDIIGGDAGSGSRQGGNVRILGGNDGAGVTFGTATIALAFNGVPGNGTSISLAANPATVSRWTGGEAAGNATGQSIEIGTGGGGAEVNAIGGTLFLGTGLPNGVGANGEIHFFYRGSALNRIGRVGPGGDWCLAGVGGSGAGPTETPLAAATALGFTWLPRIASDPLSVPTAGFSGFANPVTIEQEGGQTCIWVYNFATAAWHSTCFNAGGAIAASVPLNGVQDATGAATRAHGLNQITWGWASIPAFAAALTLTEATGGSNSALLRLTSTGTPNVFPFDVSWANGGLFSLGGPTLTGNLWTAQLGAQININGGAGNAGTSGGDVEIRGGSVSPVANSGGTVDIRGGDAIQGGAFSAFGGNSAGTGVQGGIASLTGGNSTSGGGAGRGGDVELQGGVVSSANPDERRGSVYLNSRNLGPIAAAAISGFVFLPTITATPTGVPFDVGTGKVAFIAQNNGAGGIILWAYDDVTGPAWRSVTLV